MSNSPEYYTKRNIAAWDEVAPKHESINSNLSEGVKSEKFNNLNPDFNSLLDAYGVENKSVVQICCNNGIDLLSVKKKGASRCLGVDGSNAFIDQAIMLAKSADQMDMEYLCCDIYELPVEYHSSLEEAHPILGMYEEGSPSFLDSSYFNKEPFRDTDGLDYFTYKKYDAKENFWFHHTLEDILMSAKSNKLGLEHIKELNYNISNFCADLENVDNNPPLGINLAWRKST